MKKIIIYLIIIFCAGCTKRIYDVSPYSIKKRTSPYDYTNPFYQEYFSLKPDKRPDYFIKIIENPPPFIMYKKKKPIEFYKEEIPYVVGNCIINDLTTITKYKNKFSYKLDDNFLFEVIKDSVFKSDINIWRQLTTLRKFMEVSNDILITPTFEIKNNYMEYIEFYVLNTPCNRINFLEKYLKILPKDIVLLFNLDLDNLFNVATPNFYEKKIDYQIFNKAKEDWLINIKKN
jgi:hypothetical protein